MMSHMATKEELLRDSLKLQEKGISGISIYDSAGCLDQDEVSEIISHLHEKLDISIGFHGHNNLGLGIANSYSAWKAGASIIDASLCGYGAGAGNTQLETVASYMERKGISTGIKIQELFYMADFASSTYATVKPTTDPISIACALSGLFSGFKKHIFKAAKVYDVDPFDLIGKLGDKKVVAGQEDQIYICARILASKKLSDEDDGKSGKLKVIQGIAEKKVTKNVKADLLRQRKLSVYNE